MGTVSFTFDFPGSTQGWVGSVGSGTGTFNVDSVDGNPTDSLNLLNGDATFATAVVGNWQKTTDFTSLGVPSGATVDSITVDVDVLVKPEVHTGVDGNNTIGPIDLLDSGGSIIFELISQVFSIGTDWRSLSSGSQSLGGVPATNTIIFKIAAGAVEKVNFDNFKVTLDYTGGGGGGGGTTPINGGFDLFVRGFDKVNNNRNLFVDGCIKINNQMDCFISGHDNVNRSCNLFTRGFLHGNSSVDLFTAGHNFVTSPTNLFVSGDGALINSNIPLILRGDWETVPNTGLDLFINGSLNANTFGLSTLFTKGSLGIDIVKSNTLFVHGGIGNFTDRSFPLYINGPNPISNLIPLFMGSGHFKASSSKPLFIFGSTSGGSLNDHIFNLFIQANHQHSSNNLLSLRVTGSTKPGSFTQTPLYIGGVPRTSSMILYVNGTDGGNSHVLNLYVKGTDVFGLANNTSLFLKNSHEATNYFTWMFTKGAGLNPGFSPLLTSIGLYINREPSAGCTLFIQNNDTIASRNLYIKGHESIFEGTTIEVGEAIIDTLTMDTMPPPLFVLGIPLFILGPGGSANAGTDLFVHGDVPFPINASTNLSIPFTKGKTTGNPSLYTHGFDYVLLI